MAALALESSRVQQTHTLANQLVYSLLDEEGANKQFRIQIKVYLVQALLIAKSRGQDQPFCTDDSLVQ
jgi:hypothetical protein